MLSAGYSVSVCGDSTNLLSSEIRDRFPHTLVDYGFLSSSEQLNTFYSSVSHLLFLSLHDNSPNVLMEGLSHGCVVIAFDLPFCSEHISHLRNGILIPLTLCSDLKGLSAYVIDSISDSSRNAFISEQAHLYSAATFSLDLMASRYLALFQGKPIDF